MEQFLQRPIRLPWEAVENRFPGFLLNLSSQRRPGHLPFHKCPLLCSGKWNAGMQTWPRQQCLVHVGETEFLTLKSILSACVAHRSEMVGAWPLPSSNITPPERCGRQKWEPPCTPGGMSNGATIAENSLADPQQVQH